MENNVKNSNIVYGVGGLLLGMLLMCVFSNYGGERHFRMMKKNSEEISMHQMPDGTMMMNDGSGMGGAMHSMLAGLQGKTGDEFDKAFLSEMIMHHQGAVVMAEAVLENSKRPELIKLAKDIISAQTKEIQMMKDWQKAWFK